MKYLNYIFLLILNLSFSQEIINKENYYSYFKDLKDFEKLKVKRLGTSHLSNSRIIKILREEMKNAEFEWIDDNKIIQIEEDKYLLSICYSEKQNFGFVLEEIFDAIPEKETRNYKSYTRKNNGYDYSEKIILENGKSRFVKIDTIPENLFIIKLDLYWYQSTENEEINKTLVSEAIITEIFRQDIREVLNKVKK